MNCERMPEAVCVNMDARNLTQPPQRSLPISDTGLHVPSPGPEVICAMRRLFEGTGHLFMYRELHERPVLLRPQRNKIAGEALRLQQDDISNPQSCPAKRCNEGFDAVAIFFPVNPLRREKWNRPFNLFKLNLVKRLFLYRCFFRRTEGRCGVSIKPITLDSELEERSEPLQFLPRRVRLDLPPFPEFPEIIRREAVDFPAGERSLEFSRQQFKLFDCVFREFP